MATTDVELVTFSGTDMCDLRCPAQALAKANREDDELFFCWHHKEQHFDALLNQGWTIVEDWETWERFKNGGRYL